MTAFKDAKKIQIQKQLHRTGINVMKFSVTAKPKRITEESGQV